MRTALAALSLAALLTACSQPPARKEGPAAPVGPVAVVSSDAPPPPPQADIDDADKAPTGRVNFHVCASSSLDAEDWAPVTLPAGTLFISWGERAGDERNPKLDADSLKPEAVRHVVVLKRAVTLSRKAPCDDAEAQAALSQMYDWRYPLVRDRAHLQFQVAGVENHMAFPLQGRVGDLIKRGLIFGYPLADIGHPRLLKEEG